MAIEASPILRIPILDRMFMQVQDLPERPCSKSPDTRSTPGRPKLCINAEPGQTSSTGSPSPPSNAGNPSAAAQSRDRAKTRRLGIQPTRWPVAKDAVPYSTARADSNFFPELLNEPDVGPAVDTL